MYRWTITLIDGRVLRQAGLPQSVEKWFSEVGDGLRILTINDNTAVPISSILYLSSEQDDNS